MGCFHSSFKKSKLSSFELPVDRTISLDSVDIDNTTAVDVPAFTAISISDIRAATSNFSPQLIVSNNYGDNAVNVVYRGRLHDGKWIAVKRLSKWAWPDPNDFEEEARVVGHLRHKTLANLIGYCCEEDERLLVAEYMPSGTLARHLFFSGDKWAMRLRVAMCVAQVLDYCHNQGHLLYNFLSADKILFDEKGNPRLSSFSLMRTSQHERFYDGDIIPPDYLRNGELTEEGVIYCFGFILLDLLVGKHIPPSQVLHIVRDNLLQLLLDSHVGEAECSVVEAKMVFNLASQCLQHKRGEQPSTRDLVATLALLQKKAKVPFNAVMNMQKQEKKYPAAQNPTSPLGDACSRLDLTTIHEILVKTHYKDDERTDEGSDELSFHGWTQQTKEMLEMRSHGDKAFSDKDFKTAIDCYSEFIDVGTMVSPTVYARRSLSHILLNQPKAALGDAMQAQCVCPDWHIAFYLQSVALSKLDMHTDAADMLNEGALREEEWKQNDTG